MKRYLFYLFLVFSGGFGITYASWLTWSNSCKDIDHLMREGDSITGMCVMDGSDYSGIFIFSIAISALFLIIIALVARLLGLKLVSE